MGASFVALLAQPESCRSVTRGPLPGLMMSEILPILASLHVMMLVQFSKAKAMLTKMATVEYAVNEAYLYERKCLTVRALTH